MSPWRQTARAEIEQRVDGVCPGSLSLGETLGGENLAVLLRRHGAHVFELERIADDDGAAGAIEERQRRGDIALAGFVDDDQIEEARLEG